jgi:branched-subunit amino acid transport protein AzlD
MNNTIHSLLLIAVITLVTALTRFLPFLLFRSESRIPKALEYLGGVLPGAIMGMLVVYCFKSTVVTAPPYALPEVIAAAVVVITYIWKRSTLLSIGIGTLLYMVMVQLIFV